jgi:hypothetical protein
MLKAKRFEPNFEDLERLKSLCNEIMKVDRATFVFPLNDACKSAFWFEIRGTKITVNCHLNRVNFIYIADPDFQAIIEMHGDVVKLVYNNQNAKTLEHFDAIPCIVYLRTLIEEFNLPACKHDN